MSNRPSLMEQAGISDAAPKAAAPRAGVNAQKIKMIGAGVLVLAAVVVLAWATGLIGRGGAPKVDSQVVEERRERLDQEVKQEKAREERLGITPVESGG